jgi:hypothetical protein
MPSAGSFVWGISTRQPYSARDSHQDSRLRVEVPAPTVTTSGPTMLPPMPSRVASVPSTVRWVGRVAPEVTDAGVSPAIPDCASSVAVSARCPAAACSNNIPGAAASFDQSEVERTSATVCTEPTAMPE